MGLEGYKRTAGRRNGGITKLALAGLDSVGSVKYDRRTGNAESIELVEGESFALYHFREDSAWLTEKTTIEAGFPKFERELCFTLERLDETQRAAVTELLQRSTGGVVAVIFNGSGTAHLIGMNHRDGRFFPLRVGNTELLSGRSPADLSGETVVLRNTDTAKAPLFTGELAIKNE